MIRFAVRLSLLVLLVGSAATGSRARTWHILVDGGGDVPTIQAAIDAAAMDDTLLVGPGTYSWSNQGTGNSYGMIHIMRGAPALTIMSEMGPAVTILDGEYKGRVFFYMGYYPGTPGGLTIDGFSFTNGIPTEVGNLVGGGFTAHMSSPVLRNCIFTSNTADQGGACWVGGQGSPHFIDCEFVDNTARSGGAVYAVNTPFTVAFTRCLIRNNSASSKGGGIFGYNAPLVVEECVIARNSTPADGGGIALQNCYPSAVSRCTLYGNGAASGGGISLLGSTSLTVDGTIIAGSEYGGAVAFPTTSAMTFSCSDLFGNYGGDWTGLISPQLGVDGNFSADPQFCNQTFLDLSLHMESPCVPGNHPDGADCALIGARPASCGGVPAEQRTWGAVKSMFAD